MLLRNYQAVLVLCLLSRALLGDSTASTRSAPDILPVSTAAYFEIARPKEVMDLVIDHPISQRVQNTSDFKQALESKGYLEFRAAVAIAESELGMSWRPAIATLTSGGLALGLDAQTQGAALLCRASDESVPRKLVETFVKMVNADAAQKGNGTPIKSGEYRSVTAYEFNQVRFAAVGPWLVLCNNDRLGKGIVDRILDGRGDSLATVATFREALQRRESGSAAWAFVDVASIRNAGLAKDLFRGPVDNPVAELLLGGVFANLQKTPYATAALSLNLQGLRLTLAAPHDRSWVDESREYFFGPNHKGAAPTPLATRNTLFTLRAFRDVSGMWLRAGDLFNEQINNELAKADSQLTTMFSGKDFGEDILGAFHPDWQLIVAEQDFSAHKIQPAIKLPAFAFVFRMKDPATTQPELRRTFQSLIGFLNIVGAMDGHPQLEMDIEKAGDRQLIWSNYIPTAAENGTKPARLHFNFSPTVAFSDERFIVSSSKGLAAELLDAKPSRANDIPPAATVTNTQTVLQFAVLRDVLVSNRDQLVAQNMLEKGHQKAEAEREIDLLLSLLEMVREHKATIETDDRSLRLLFELSLK